ncbi:hypothetical protein [Mesorhizobium sp. B2-3-14]|uniref:hypothetical protein n=1 Tax=Mesorhizobium sp. B2-3-14 TaxID=2589950 RepID=UPI0015E43107|nr:hypothetical protein [Mesorhizobium sp. B2-3-14]
MTASKAFLALLKKLPMLSGKTPKKSHIFLLTEEQPRREIRLQQGSELQRDVIGRAAIH